MRKLKESLGVKLLAAALSALLLPAAALSGLGAAMTWSGLGTAENFYSDPLCQGLFDGALRTAGDLAGGTSQERLLNILSNRFGGFAYEVWDGSPETGTLLIEGGTAEGGIALEDRCAYRYSSPSQSDTVIEQSGGETGEAAQPGYYTVVGRLGTHFPQGSAFFSYSQLWELLHSLGTLLPFLTAVLLALTVAALVFLASAAGHRRGREGIVPSWQDRVPLDLYLLCQGVLLCALIALAVEASYGFQNSAYSFNAPAFAGMLTCAMAGILLCVALLMSLSTRIKIGKWWRNSLVYFLFRGVRRLWRKLWGAAADFIRILPLVWRVILAVGGILVLQSVFVLLFFIHWSDFMRLLIFLAVLWADAVLVAAAGYAAIHLQQLRDAGHALAQGDLEAKVDTRRMLRDLKAHGEDLNAIGEGMTRAVEQRLKSERLKTELITNVSHDIKTPLTSIVNYVDLLKKEELPPQAEEYLQVLDRQSRRLKKLTEDLVEASKASTGNVAVHLEAIVLNELVHQAIGDYSEKLSAGRLEVVVNTYEGNLVARADGRLLWRVLDNLLGNVCKYALAGTRVYVDLGRREDRATLSIKNISRDPLNVNAGELMERFVRGDASRHTEGSGLGLNIALSLMELMGGTFEIHVDGDLFKAELTLAAADPTTVPA